MLLTSSYMKSGSELFAKRSVLIRVCSENVWLRKASPKGGSIPLTLGYKREVFILEHERLFKTNLLHICPILTSTIFRKTIAFLLLFSTSKTFS